ncbi:hypothetical protein JD276_11170 [Leucobacter sp. CSA1]|uniref:DUF3558 domain-containing protein n=1 Tax=Leucobacter chromiisoli TaxID=2796471 RepID=A0A934Q7B9_9MICO|nr:hypothetical protein [Leucobacter chromiisoli]MBK0419594.1 hypothetical protein [Leucobacter chromiisoli]
MNRAVRRGAPGAVAAVLLVALSACAPEPTSESQESPAETETPTSSPAETTGPPPETGSPIVIPECERLIPLNRIVGRFSPEWAPVPEDQQLVEIFEGAIGPVARESLDRASQRRFCAWGIPNSDGLIHINVAELPQDVRDRLVAALRESDYIESEEAGAEVFISEIEGPFVGAHDIWYGFAGNVWVTSLGSGLGDLAIEGMRAANPGLRAE